jgi:hypothetical protein
MTTTPTFAPAAPTEAGALSVADFVEVIPAFVAVGPRGGRYRYRATRVDSGITSIVPLDEDRTWVRLRFASFRGVYVDLPAAHVITARVAS